MTIKDLKEILNKYDENIEISFGKVDEEGGIYCNCEVEIEIDAVYDDLIITVFITYNSKMNIKINNIRKC